MTLSWSARIRVESGMPSGALATTTLPVVGIASGPLVRAGAPQGQDDAHKGNDGQKNSDE